MGPEWCITRRMWCSSALVPPKYARLKFVQLFSTCYSAHNTRVKVTS